MKSWPEIPRSALVAWDAEIARDRKNKTLGKLGSNAAEAAAVLSRLSHKRSTRVAVKAAITSQGK